MYKIVKAFFSMFLVISLIGSFSALASGGDLNEFEKKYDITYHHKIPNGQFMSGSPDFTLYDEMEVWLKLYTGVTRIESNEELNERFSKSPQIIAMYDDTVFEDEFLLVFTWCTGSPGFGFRVTSVSCEEDVNVEMTVDHATGNVLTVIENWTVILKMPVSLLSKNVSLSHRKYFPVSTPERARVAGRILSYNPGEQTTVTLMRGGVEAYKTKIEAINGIGQVNQAFAFDGVEPGTYDLVVTKQAHLTYTLTDVIVGSDDVDLTQNSDQSISMIILPCGDINGDGFINSSDLSILILPSNYNKKSTDAGVNSHADLTGAGWVDSSSLSVIILPANYNKTRVVCPYR